MIRYQDKIPVFIVTKGDTNQWNDPFMLKPNQVIGILKRKYLLISSSFGWMIAKISLLNTFGMMYIKNDYDDEKGLK